MSFCCSPELQSDLIVSAVNPNLIAANISEPTDQEYLMRVSVELNGPQANSV